ncbi:MAG TPA: hypothetical protein VN030_03300 [Cellvibrio sp.]|nr:hypothetical protein [Cellvibrio sp.]
MPVFINEMITETIPAPVPQPTQQAEQSSMPLSPSENEMIKVLQLMQERQARLQFD